MARQIPPQDASSPSHRTGGTDGNAVTGKEKIRQTGRGTAPHNLDVADPHPSDEEHPYKAPQGGDASPPPDTDIGNDNIGPNPSRHDGSAPQRPHNRGSGPA
jgi:hypothetical protein